MRKNLFIALAVLTGLVISMTACDRLGDVEELERKALKDNLGLTAVNISAIEGVTVPATGESPVRNIVGDAQYAGIVTWLPNDTTFKEGIKYTATITLTPKDGYTLQMVKPNFFTVAGAESVTNSANSGVIKAVFPQTIPVYTINIASIQGVTVPVVGITPATEITETEQYSGTVTWSPAVSGTFVLNTRYTATITLTAKTDYTLKGVAVNYFTVAGAESVTNGASSGVIRAVFPPAARLVEMIQIPGGSFQMGGSDGYDAQPVHTVTLSGFYMGKYEVTQEQWTAVMGDNPSVFTDSPATGEVQSKRPVERVRWYDALVFCNKLSMREGLSPAYRISGSTDPAIWENLNWENLDAVQIVAGSTGYRLPTEAQWEYAARGGNGSPGNYTYSGSNAIDDVAWYGYNSSGKTHEVGKKTPNGLGLYDMSGNVWEWCWDWYGGYSSGTQTDPVGADSGSTRVLRGGSWYNSAWDTRSAYRCSSYPDSWFFIPIYGDAYVGFRLVRP
jgi:formylglycine-generating enzyme